MGALFIAAPILSSNPSQAYQIDCAILICLSGGWPGDPVCTAARAEFIRRITPWPIEPPLQIWRCPMKASFPAETPIERIWSISMTALPAQSYVPNNRLNQSLLIEVATGPTANVDISGDDFDFVRSIHVYDIDYDQHVVNSSGGQDCVTTRSRVKRGSYGTQGDFSWANIGITAAPAWLGVKLTDYGICQNAGRFRGVGVEWTDYFGKAGFEVVRY